MARIWRRDFRSHGTIGYRWQRGERRERNAGLHGPMLGLRLTERAIAAPATSGPSRRTHLDRDAGAPAALRGEVEAEAGRRSASTPGGGRSRSRGFDHVCERRQGRWGRPGWSGRGAPPAPADVSEHWPVEGADRRPVGTKPVGTVGSAWSTPGVGQSGGTGGTAGEALAETRTRTAQAARFRHRDGHHVDSRIGGSRRRRRRDGHPGAAPVRTTAPATDPLR